MEKKNKKKDYLEMTFDPSTIEHLGVRMYSTLPPVIAELVANAYDANAGHVDIILVDDKKDKLIIVEDNGDGMSFDEMNDKFLRIGRNRRIEGKDDKPEKERRVIGRKGLGKLSFFGISEEIEVHSTKNGKENAFLMEWKEIKKSKKREYRPKIIVKNKTRSGEKSGTAIILRKLQRESSFKPEDLAVSLSKMFILDSSFNIFIRRNSEKAVQVENKKKYTDLKKEVEWGIPKDVKLKDDYFQENKISGHLIASEKPIPPNTNMRGVTLFSRKKLVNLPEYFSDSTSSHFFSYLTGWLEVDFIDDLDEDVISTDRQSLNWGHPKMAELRDKLRILLNWLEQDWRKKRSEIRTRKLEEKTGLPVEKWLEHVPDNIKKNLEPLIMALIKDSEMTEKVTTGSVKGLQKIIQPYPYFHWRNLHSEVQKMSEPYYISKDYYTAVFEVTKRYINKVKDKSGIPKNDWELLENVFNEKNSIINVTGKFKKPDGANFGKETLDNITGGHRMLVFGAWRACRCPIAHEEVNALRDSGLFTEQDCLDALSLLSHLFNRLDKAKVVKSP